jgi:branched-chain amino acid aminotransferase
MLGVNTLRFDDKNKRRVTIAEGVNNRSISQFRTAVLNGKNVFETMRSYYSSNNSVVFCLAEHLERLRRSAELMTVPMPETGRLVTEISEAAVGDCAVRVTLGEGGERIVEASPFDFGRVGRPVKVGIYEVDDSPEFPSTAKHGFRSAWAESAKRQLVDEVLLVSSRGEILEANNSNVFAVIDGQVVTPPLDGRQLEGVTRRCVIELALGMGLQVQERRLLVGEHFDELFLTSSLKEVAPVTSIAGRALTGGPVTAKLHQGFSALYV